MKTGLLYLIFSAIMECFWNIALKKSAGIFDWVVNIVGVFFLVLVIISFKKALDSVPLSIASVVWSGISLTLTIGLDMVLYKTKIDIKVGFFMALALVSIFGLSYYSSVE